MHIYVCVYVRTYIYIYIYTCIYIYILLAPLIVKKNSPKVGPTNKPKSGLVFLPHFWAFFFSQCKPKKDCHLHTQCLGSWVFDHGSLASGPWTLDLGSWILDPGPGILEPGSWTLEAWHLGGGDLVGCWLLAVA